MRPLFFFFVLGSTSLGLVGCADDPPPPAVYVLAAPPAERVEIVGDAPSEAYVWVAGHWHWDADRAAYVWIPGRWLARPSVHAVWVAGHWRNTRRGWVYIPGHFR